MNLEEVIKTSDVIVHDGRFAYLKAKSVPDGHFFMITQDDDEITVIAREDQVEQVDFAQENKWWKLIEVRVSAPFVATGFLATVSKTIADNELSVLIVSTFSKDYVLVREETWQKAVTALKTRGFTVI